MHRVGNWGFRLLCFLKVADRQDGSVSLTNLCVWAALIKLTQVAEPSIVDLTALVVAMMAYAHKRVVNRSKVAPAQDAPPIFDPAPLLAKVRDLEAFVGTVKLGSHLGRR